MKSTKKKIKLWRRGDEIFTPPTRLCSKCGCRFDAHKLQKVFYQCPRHRVIINYVDPLTRTVWLYLMDNDDSPRFRFRINRSDRRTWMIPGAEGWARIDINTHRAWALIRDDSPP